MTEARDHGRGRPSTGSRGQHRSGARRWAMVLGVALAVIAADQLTKRLGARPARRAVDVIDLIGSLRFNLAFNTGMAFSKGSGAGALIGIGGARHRRRAGSSSPVEVRVQGAAGAHRHRHRRCARQHRGPADPGGRGRRSAPPRASCRARWSTSSTCSGGRCSTSQMPQWWCGGIALAILSARAPAGESTPPPTTPWSTSRPRPARSTGPTSPIRPARDRSGTVAADHRGDPASARRRSVSTGSWRSSRAAPAPRRRASDRGRAGAASTARSVVQAVASSSTRASRSTLLSEPVRPVGGRRARPVGRRPGRVQRRRHHRDRQAGRAWWCIPGPAALGFDPGPRTARPFPGAGRGRRTDAARDSCTGWTGARRACWWWPAPRTAYDGAGATSCPSHTVTRVYTALVWRHLEHRRRGDRRADRSVATRPAADDRGRRRSRVAHPLPRSTRSSTSRSRHRC